MWLNVLLYIIDILLTRQGHLPRNGWHAKASHARWRKWTGCSRLPARMSVIKLFLARNIIYFCGLNKTLCQPGSFHGFWKLVCCTCSQARIFQEILHPQPGILKKVRYNCSQAGVFREYTLSRPRSILKFLSFLSKKNCQ